MLIDIARFILYTAMIMGIVFYLYITVFEILIHNKFLYGKYFPKEADYKEFIKQNSQKYDVFGKR
ncbi:TPA: hypothetical protein QCU60_004333 [Bacillus cereus]|nr:hypothetical protein [Bacillus cereus]HDR6312347.1 hypothetical protein [Bacillus cereus]